MYLTKDQRLTAWRLKVTWLLLLLLFDVVVLDVWLLLLQVRMIIMRTAS
jgi:hypothetical protein